MKTCPTPEILEELLEDRLDEPQARTVSSHVESCSRCQELLETLTQPALPARSAAADRLATATLLAPDPSQPAFLSRLRHAPPPPSSILLAAATERADPRSRPLHDHPIVPGYEIQGEIGRGGMGVVYKAAQVRLNRLVALKMVLVGPHPRGAELERFRTEAEAIAHLRHPNIVQIHDLGEVAGRPYFALEYAEGGSLADHLAGNPQQLLPTARLVETLARAIHHAHTHGIIHRDLKPANVLLVRKAILRVDETGAEAVAGPPAEPPSPTSPSEPFWQFEPKVSDFGLAKRLDEASDRTQNGEMIGTPSYMAPEQAAGNGKPVGPTTDVYALGAILYELLTGRPPFKGAQALDTVWQVLHEEPVRPAFLRPGLPRDLETICLKCLNKDPQRRYSSALALADDLKRYGQGKPISARPVGSLERAWKWSRRKPLVAALLAGVLLVGLLGFAGVTWQWREAAAGWAAALAQKQEKELQMQAAEEARAAAVEAQWKEADQRQRARSALYYSRIAQSQLAWRVNDHASATVALTRCRPTGNQDDQRGWEWYYLHGLYHSYLYNLKHARPGLGGGVAYSPDGKRIAGVVGGDPIDETSSPAEVRIWEAATGKLIRAHPAPGPVNRLALGPLGARLALGGTDGVVHIWDVLTGEELHHFQAHDRVVSCLAFSPDGKFLASASWDRQVKIHDVLTGSVRSVLPPHREEVQNLAFHPDGQLLASACWDGTVRIWDVRNNHQVQNFPAHKGRVYALAFSPDGKFLASASQTGTIKIWEVSGWRRVHILTGGVGAILNVAWSPDGRFLGYGGSDATLRLWDFEAGIERLVFRGHAAPVEGLAFSPNGRRLASCSPAEGTVKLWDLTRHPEYATFARSGADIEDLAFTGKGDRVVSVTVHGKVQVWEESTGALLSEQEVPLNCLTPDNTRVISPAMMVSLNPVAEHLAGRSAQDRRLVKIWSVASGQELRTCSGHTLEIIGVRYSPNGKYLASIGYDLSKPGGKHELLIWDAQTGEQKTSHQGTGRVYALAFSPDGLQLAWGGEAGMLQVWDWSRGPMPPASARHKGNVIAMVFNEDGSLLASASVEDQSIKLWTVTTPASIRLKALIPAPALVCDLCFHPDSRRLAGISRDLVKVWDVETAQEVLTLRGAPPRHYDAPFNPRIVFSPDGSRLAGTNWDESISLWEAGLQMDSLVSRLVRRRLAAEARAPTWHLEECAHALEHKNVPAARFHLERLRGVSLTPPLQRRFEQLRRQLARP